MTDRDEFAAAALTGLLAGSEHSRDCDAADHTEAAYYIADAMLRARATEDRDMEHPSLTKAERFAIRYCLTRTLEKHLVGHFRKDEEDVCIHGVMLKRTLLDLIDRFPCKPKE